MRRVVGRQHIDEAGIERTPKRRVVTGLADRRIASKHAAFFGNVVIGQKQILRTGLGRDVEAAGARGGDMRQGIGGALMRDVQAHAGRFRERDGPRDRFGRRHRRPGFRMSTGVDAALLLELMLTSRDDAEILCVHDATLAQARDALKALVHHAIVRRGKRPESELLMKHLKPTTPCALSDSRSSRLRAPSRPYNP